MRAIQEQVTILDTADTSSELDCRGSFLVGILADANFDGASLTIEVLDEATDTWTVMQDDAGVAVPVTLAASQYARLLPNEFAMANKVRFVSGAAQAGADSVLTVSLVSD